MPRNSIAPITEGSITNESLHNFLNGIQLRYPSLDKNEVEELALRLLTEVGDHLGNGEDIAFVRRKDNGSAELTILGLRPINK